MATNFVERGYGQVEPNRLSGITFGNIEAQAPAYFTDTLDSNTVKPIAELENGRFLCVVANSSVESPFGRIAVPVGEAAVTDTPYLVFSERKRYDERDSYCDFVDKAADKVDGMLFPRLVGLTPDSCIFTTNTIADSYNASDHAVGNYLYIGDDGYLTKTKPVSNPNTTYRFLITQVTTMPDGQRALKLQVKQYA